MFKSYGTPKISFFGVDMPAIDYTIPHIDSLELDLKYKDAKPGDIKKVNRLYDAILEVFGKYKHGGKYSFSEEQTKAARKLTYKMESILTNHDIKIKYTGGTVYNKMYNLKAILGDAVECNLVGTVGKDKNGDFLYNKIKNEGINLINNGEFVKTTREAVHIIPRNHKDRIIGKFVYKTPSFMNNNFISKQAMDNEIIFIEGSTLKFLGNDPENLRNYVDSLNANSRKLVFSPPTDKSFYYDAKTKKFDRARAEAFYYAGRKSDIVFMNEKEAIKFTHKPSFEGEISGYNDPLMRKVRKIIFDKMNAKDIELEEKPKPNQLAFITMGDKGSIGISKNYEIFQPVQAGINVVSTSGCGDSFTAGVMAEWYSHGNKEYNQDYIKRLLMKGTQVATAVIQEIPAQIGPEKIKEAFDARPSILAREHYVLRDSLSGIISK